MASEGIHAPNSVRDPLIDPPEARPTKGSRHRTVTGLDEGGVFTKTGLWGGVPRSNEEKDEPAPTSS